MRTHLALTVRITAAISLAVVPCASLAQLSRPGQPSACVRAIGPDVAMPTSDSVRLSPDSVTRRRAASRDTLPVAVRLIASVSANEIRFEKSPVVCVRLTGDAQLDSVHVLARKNLATPVVRGGTYRDVYVAVEILGRLNADCIAARITGAAVPATSPDSAARCASLDARAAGGRP